MEVLSKIHLVCVSFYISTHFVSGLSWIPLGGNEFMFSEHHSLPQMNFLEASAYCQSMDGHLVSILSKAEEDFVKSTADIDVWIGLKVADSVTVSGCRCAHCNQARDKATSAYCTTCIHCRSLWTWTDDNPVTHTFWNEHEPNQSHKCAIHHSTRGWVDADCSLEFNFFCKRVVNGTRLMNAEMTTEKPESGTSVTENCAVSDRNGCTSCQMWYIYSGVDPKGKCVNYLEKLALPKSVELEAGEVKSNSITVHFKQVDLPVSAYGADYYFYRLQFKSVDDTEGDFRDAGHFHRHYNFGSEQWITMTAGIMENTKQYVRVALYRRVEFRGWLDLCDYTDVTITVTTQGLSWIIHDQYEYMFSDRNELAQDNNIETSLFCDILGGNLVSILSKNEMDFINVYASDRTWIGLTVADSVELVGCWDCDNCVLASDKNASAHCIGCIRCRSLWKWMDNSTVTNTFWSSRSPSSGYGTIPARCAYLNWFGQWVDIPCLYVMHFICKRGVNPSFAVEEDYPTGLVSEEEHCENDECTSCEKWYIYSELSPIGRCVRYLECVRFPPSMNITEGTVKGNKITLHLKSEDIPIPAYAVDYYFYGLRYKEVGSEGNLIDVGNFVQHYIGEQSWMNFTVDFKENTSYYITVALYRKVELRGWLDVCDSTEPVIITTGSLNWQSHEGHWYMYSERNALSSRNFEDASAFCSIVGTNLTSILTVTENEFLNKNQYYGYIGYIVSNISELNSCIGSCAACANSDDNGSNEDCTACSHCRSIWNWVDGSPTTYQFWGDDEPHGYSSSSCATMCDDGVWCSYSCFRSNHFTCKRSFTANTETTARTTSKSIITSGGISEKVTTSEDLLTSQSASDNMENIENMTRLEEDVFTTQSPSGNVGSNVLYGSIGTLAGLLLIALVSLPLVICVIRKRNKQSGKGVANIGSDTSTSAGPPSAPNEDAGDTYEQLNLPEDTLPNDEPQYLQVF